MGALAFLDRRRLFLHPEDSFCAIELSRISKNAGRMTNMEARARRSYFRWRATEIGRTRPSPTLSDKPNSDGLCALYPCFLTTTSHGLISSLSSGQLHWPIMQYTLVGYFRRPRLHRSSRWSDSKRTCDIVSDLERWEGKNPTMGPCIALAISLSAAS